MNIPSTAEYQRHRTATLRGLSHERVLKTARELLKANQKKGHKYPRKIKQALRATQ